MKKTVIAVLIAVLLVACGDGDPDLSGGYVHGRRYVPSSTVIIPIQHCSGGYYAGKVYIARTCWTQMLPTTYPDHWDLYLTDGKTKGWTSVSEHTYLRCKDELWCNVDGKHPEHTTVHDS